ncbi:receptor protein-tyrosine kinase [Balamuthia mandrillaris]
MGTTGTHPGETLVDFAGDILGDYIYVFGGDDTSDMLDYFSASLFALDTRTRVWSQVSVYPSVFPPGRIRHAVVAARSKLYVYGGSLDGDYNPANDMWVFDPVSGAWEEVWSGADAAQWSGITSLQGHIFLHGGVFDDSFSYPSPTNVFLFANLSGDVDIQSVTVRPQDELDAKATPRLVADEQASSIWIFGPASSSATNGYGGSSRQQRLHFKRGVEDLQWPVVDEFESELPCGHGIMLYPPTMKVLCRGNENEDGIFEMRTECNYDGGCLALSPPDACPPYEPYLCPSMVCEWRIENCGGFSPSCFDQGKITCFNGQCASTCQECIEQGAPPCSMFRCCDGSCRHNVTSCPPLPACPWSAPFRCSSGLCQETHSSCGSDQTCPKGTKLCPDGLCVIDGLESCESSESFCPVSSSICIDLTCAPEGDECTEEQSYCGDGKVICWDGSCVLSGESCPAPLLATHVAPMAVFLYSITGTLTLPLVNQPTNTIFGSVTVEDTSPFQDGDTFKVNAPLFSIVLAGVFEDEDNSRMIGPCWEVTNDATGIGFVNAEVSMSLAIDVPEHLRASQLAIVRYNAGTWGVIQTEAQQTASTTASYIKAELSASYYGPYGTFCVAHFGDTRPSLALAILGPSVVALRSSGSEYLRQRILVTLSAGAFEDVVIPLSFSGTAIEHQNWLVGSARQLDIFAGHKTSSYEILFISTSSGFFGYRDLQITLGEAQPPQLQISAEARTAASFLLTTSFQSIRSTGMLIIFPGPTLVHQLIPLLVMEEEEEREVKEEEAERQEQEQLQLDVVFRGIRELDEEGREVIFHHWAEEREFTPQQLDNATLVLSSELPFQQPSIPLGVRFTVADCEGLCYNPNEDQDNVLQENVLRVEVVLTAWNLNASTTSIQIETELYSHDGSLRNNDEEEAEEREELSTNLRKSNREGRREDGITTTTFRTDHTQIIYQVLTNDTNVSLSPTEYGSMKVIATLPLFNNSTAYDALIYFRTLTSPIPSNSSSSSSASSSSVDSGAKGDEDEDDDQTKLGLAVGLSVGLTFLMICCVVVAALVYFTRRQRQKKRTRLNRDGKDVERLPLGFDEVESTPTSAPSSPTLQQRNKQNDNLEMMHLQKGGSSITLDYNELQVGKKIGEGSFGKVHQGSWQCVPVAIKIIENISPDVKQQFQHEVETLQNLRPHPNVVLLYGVCMGSQTPLCIVTELLPRGSLSDYLHSDEGQQLSPLDMLRIAKGVAAGMMHLHAERLLHCDLAARNVLLSDTLEAKVADFGMARVLREGQDYHQTLSNEGPVRWMVCYSSSCYPS